MKNNKSGFTLIELLVVIAIIGLLSTLSILALNQARARARDAKRISDVRQIQTALELYYNDKGDYPGTVTPGGEIKYGDNVYLANVPTPPSIVDGGSCPAIVASEGYTYIRTGVAAAGTASYTIKYCLGAAVNDVPGNTPLIATPAGIAATSTPFTP